MIKTPYFSEMNASSMITLGSAILLVLSITSWLPSSANARGITAETILKTTKTITGEKIVYPLSGEALVEVVVVTILPGEKRVCTDMVYRWSLIFWRANYRFIMRELVSKPFHRVLFCRDEKRQSLWRKR